MYYLKYFQQFFFVIICKDGSFQTWKYKNERLEHSFKPISISINHMDKFEKKIEKEENIYKKHLV